MNHQGTSFMFNSKNPDNMVTNNSTERVIQLENYSSLQRFIREQIIDKNLQINKLSITKSAIKSITDRFTGRAWMVERIEKEGSRFQLHKIKSPDGSIELSMVSGKVFRHPKYVEQICKRKHLTKRMLELSGLPTPLGADFRASEKEIASAFFDKMPKPTVIKPTDSGGSAGVTVGVSDKDGFDRAWNHALQGRPDSNVLIESFVQGVELRAFIVGNNVLSVVARIQPYVIGDGLSDVSALIDDLLDRRSINYRAMKLPPVPQWEFIKEQGFESKTVPKQGDLVVLSPFCLPSKGAFLVDVTSSVSTEIKELAKRAMKSIPHLEIAGVDILVDDLSDHKTAYILEVNTAASLDLHRYPTHGEPRAVDIDVVDYFDSVYSETISSPLPQDSRDTPISGHR